MIFTQNDNYDLVEMNDEAVNALTEEKFVVALDFDGVITDPYKLKTEYINEHGYHLEESQCGYDMCIRKLGVKIEDYEKGLKRAFTEEPAKLPLERDFKEYLAKLKDLNISIFIITNRTKDMLKHLQEYLKHHEIRVEGVIITEYKSKTKALEVVNAKAFVEDSPFKLSQIINENKDIMDKCALILYRNAQNMVELSPDKGILEAGSWKEAYGLILGEYEKIS